MDRDYDIEMEDVEAYAAQGTEPEDILPVDDAQEPGEVIDDVQATADATTEVVRSKVHLRGLDTLNPDDIKSYFNEHSGGGRFERIEWVDDSSANLIFSSESQAAEAIASLSAIELADATQLTASELLPAKQYSKKPDVALQVRFAVASDRKVVGAASRSRFYLLNPEYDPEERRRNGDFNRRGKYRDRDDRGDRDRDYDRRYYRRNGGGRIDDRYRDEETETFDVSLYDDDDAALAKREEVMPRSRRRRYSRSRSRSGSGSRSWSRPQSGGGSDSDRRTARPDNRGKELFPDIGSRRDRDRNGGGGGSSMRDRSASPARSRDGSRDLRVDGHYGFEAAADSDASAGRNREKARAIKDRLSAPRAANDAKELFPSKLSSGGVGAKELFPSKVSSIGSGGAQMDKMVDNIDIVSKRLSDRITTTSRSSTSTPAHTSSSTAIAAAAPDTTSTSTFNIRGIAKQTGDAGLGGGISIKGRAATAKELFPKKLGNAGKELFADKLEGRGRPRRKAEDLFH